MRPTIGVTMSFEPADGPEPRLRGYLNAGYSDAVYAAGGMPFPISLPPPAGEHISADARGRILDEIIERCDGFIFTGGPDIDPKHYGQSRHEKTGALHPRRDAFEIEFFRRVDAAARPVLSICLGCQVTNVCRGGQLVQHVDDLNRGSAVTHYRSDHGSAFHDVRVEPKSRLAAITGNTTFEVNSRHHQVLDAAAIGGRLKPVAFAPDGVVEAAEDTEGRFLVAVQWHPEDMIDRREHLRLFEALVEEALRARR